MSILESFLAGKEARRVADAAEQINAMQAFIGQNGQAIMAGDQNALGQLAGFGVQGLQTAMGVQENMEARQDRAYTRQRQAKMDARGDQEWEMKLAEYKASLTDAQRAAEAASLENAAKMALTAQSPEDWDRLATENGAPELVGQFGNREAVAARFMSMAEVLKAQEPVEGPEWRPATPEEAAAYGAKAGQISSKTGEFKRTPVDSGTVIETGPDGRTIVRQGPGVGATDGGTGVNSGDALRTQITDAQSMLDMISTIANDPALSKVTGALEGGGGNNVDDFGAARAAWYGGDGLAVVQKIAQLQGNAWLGARALLKGGGQITDYESKKAESAMARLSRRQGDAEFRAALKDLEDALREGVRKLQEAQGGAAPPSATADAPATGNKTSTGVEWSIAE